MTEKKERIVVWGAVFIFTLSISAYILLGQWLIKHIYEKNILPKQGIYPLNPKPLDYYLNITDLIFYRNYFYLILSFLIFLPLYLAWKENKIKIMQARFYLLHPEKENGWHCILKYDLPLALLAYCITCLLYFFPVIKYIRSSFFTFTYRSDLFASQWGLWYGINALKSNIKGFTFTNLIFYPEGISLFFTEFSFYNIIAAYLLNFFTKNLNLIENILILHTFVLGGIGGFLLVRYITKNSYLGFLGGFIFAFNPSHIEYSQLHLSTVSTQFIPFFVLYFIKTLREDRKRHIALCAFYFLLNLLCGWYYFLFGVYFLISSYAYLAITRKKLLLKDVLAKFFIITLPTIAIFSGWFLNMITLLLKNPSLGRRAGYDICVSDLAGFFLPHSRHILLKSLSPVDMIRYVRGFWNEAECYLGIINLTLVLCALKELVKRCLKYLLAFLAFISLSLGVTLRVLGVKTFIAMPYFFLRSIPLLSLARAPIRIIAYGYCFWAILVALALKLLYQKIKLQKKWKNLALVLIAILIFFDYFSIIKTKITLEVPAVYGLIKKDSDFGILNIPVFNKGIGMFYQTQHKIPIVEGLISQKINTSLADYLELKDIKKQKSQLIAHRVKYIVVHKDLIDVFSQKEMYHLEEYSKNYRLLYEDDRNILFGVY